MTPRSTGPLWPTLFAVVTAAHLVLLGLDATPWDSITKCLIAPTLIGWALAADGPRALLGFLFFCLLGDLFLEIEPLFIVGMAAFAVAHVVLIGHLVRRGALDGLRARPWLVAVYGVPAIGLVVWLWGGLPADLLVPVPVYTALLLTTAVTAIAVDRVVGAGGLLFLVSDGIIALGIAERIPPDAVLTKLAIMTLYSSAIALITVGLLRPVPSDVAPQQTTRSTGQRGAA